MIDEHITFWGMAPAKASALFENAGGDARAMAWPGREIVLGTNAARKGIVAKLPPGRWLVQRFDAMAMKHTVLAEATERRFRFGVPASRAVLVHLKRQE
jgi:hypothetical protein